MNIWLKYYEGIEENMIIANWRKAMVYESFLSVEGLPVLPPF